MTKVKITQTRSTIGRSKKQIATLQSLGLNGIGDKTEREVNPIVKGMINKVSFMVKVEEVK